MSMGTYGVLDPMTMMRWMLFNSKGRRKNPDVS